MLKKELTVGIILIFILSSLIPITSSYSSYETNKVYTIHIDEESKDLVSTLTPMVIGNNNTEISEDKMLNNIVFVSATKNGSNADAYISRYLEQRSTQSDDEIIEPIETSTQKPSPICNVKCFFFGKVNSSGHTNYAEEKMFLGGKKVTIMYYKDGGDWSRGYASIQGMFSVYHRFPFVKVFDHGDFSGVLSIVAYGFRGETSWDGYVQDDDVWMDGSAFIVRVGFGN